MSKRVRNNHQRQVPAAVRERVKENLIKAYKVGHATSGDVVVTSLGFSRNPDKWHISAKTRRGAPYPDSTHMARTDVHITAVLSYDWVTQPVEDSILRAEDVKQYDIIAGIRELDPPKHVDKLELLTVSRATEGGLRLATEYLFRFTTGGSVLALGRGLVLRPSHLKLAIPFACKMHEQAIAKMVADRLIPKRKTKTSPSF